MLPDIQLFWIQYTGVSTNYQQLLSLFELTMWGFLISNEQKLQGLNQGSDLSHLTDAFSVLNHTF